MRATLIEAISRHHGGAVLDAQYGRIAKRRGANNARVALAPARIHASAAEPAFTHSQPARS